MDRARRKLTLQSRCGLIASVAANLLPNHLPRCPPSRMTLSAGFVCQGRVLHLFILSRRLLPSLLSLLTKKLRDVGSSGSGTNSPQTENPGWESSIALICSQLTKRGKAALARSTLRRISAALRSTRPLLGIKLAGWRVAAPYLRAVVAEPVTKCSVAAAALRDGGPEETGIEAVVCCSPQRAAARPVSHAASTAA